MGSDLNSLELEVLKDIANGNLLGADYHETRSNDGNDISADLYIKLERRGYIELVPSSKPYAGIGDQEIAGITVKGRRAIES